MKLPFPCKCLLAVVLVALSSGCVTHRTVTKGGKTVKSGYVVKKPFEKPGD
jgi:hypothetical protein